MAKRAIILKKKKKEFSDLIKAWFPREMTFEERAQKFHTDDNW